MCLQKTHKATQKINLYTLQQNLVLMKFLITDKEMAVQNGLNIYIKKKKKLFYNTKLG